MTSLKIILITFCLNLLYNEANTQTKDEWVSPCPRFFVYETKGKEFDRWYGKITLLSEIDLTGIELSINLDRPSVQLGNWLGQVSTSDNKDYLIENRDRELKAHVPQTVRFYIKYNISEPPPKLISFGLNTKRICPEEGITQAPSVTTPSEIVSTRIPDVGIANKGGRPSLEILPIDNDNKELNAICGTVIPQALPLITFGQETVKGEFPWHSALYYAQGIRLIYICGASLITKYHVITVAHCVTKRRSEITLNPQNLLVYLDLFSSPGIQDRRASQIIVHAQYNSQTFAHDIALVKFSNPAEFTDHVRPVCLWEESRDLDSVLNKIGTTVGWGFDETGKVTDTLMQVKMPVVSQETCIFSFPDFYSRFTSSNTYCAGFRNGSSVCNGDSGGGMVFPKTDSNPNNPVWQLRGLITISVALQNQVKCDTTHYVVFTDIAKYLYWIKKSLKI